MCSLDCLKRPHSALTRHSDHKARAHSPTTASPAPRSPADAGAGAAAHHRHRIPQRAQFPTWPDPTTRAHRRRIVGDRRRRRYARPMISTDVSEARVLIGHEFLTQLLSDARASTSRILISSFLVQLFDSKVPRVPERIRAVLESAHHRGVSVQLLAGQAPPSKILSELPFPVRVYSGPELMHAKFCVFDSEVSIVGGHNLSYRGTLVNQEVSVRLTSWEVAAQLSAYYLRLWRGSRVITSSRH